MEVRVVLVGCADRVPSVRGGGVRSAVLLIERRSASFGTALDVRGTREHLAEAIEKAHVTSLCLSRGLRNR
jgi:hypothetical protein